MSAIGPKQTSASALHMSAFGGKADIAFCGANVRFWSKALLLTQSGRHPRGGQFRIAGLRAAVVNWWEAADRIGLYQDDFGLRAE